MKKLQVLLIALLALCAPFAHSTTYTVNSGQSTATIQGVINGTAAGDTVSFSAGTYSITTGVTLKCGVTYTGPVATPATAILASTFGQSGPIFSLFTGSGFANPCTQATTIEYLNFKNSGGIYVKTSFTNLTIVHNQFSNIPCCNSAEPATTGIWFDGAQSTSNTAQVLTNTLIQWNTVGDSASCLSPASAFADTSSPDGNGDAGSCNGIITNTSINGLTVKNNNFVHVSEGMHILCPGGGHPGGSQPCEPTSNGVQTKNIDIEFNDFVKNHRINFEEQPQTITNVVWANNSVHDMLNPTAFSFGLSFACCGGGATPPYLNSSNNVVILNTPPAGRYGYGDEAWGKSATYDNNLIQSGTFSSSATGLAWGFGPVAHMDNNTVCGSFAGGYIADEGYGQTPPTRVGNSTGPTCAAATSVAPSIFPASGATPLTVTLSDPGYTSGAVPQGNTSIWYTTDGTTPVPGQGTTQFYSGPFTLTTATVKAVGMWGARNQPLSYPSGYGFVPSPVVTSTFTSAAAAATPVFSPGSTSFATSLNVSISDATVGATIYYTTDGSTPTTSSTAYSGPITITGASTVVKAMAIKSGYSQSAIAAATYLSTTIVSTPTFSPPSETFAGTVSVAISDLTPASTIYYTTDGSTPGTTGGGGGGATYYLSASGSDSNSGTSSGSPWLSPNHALNCGDTILAAAGTYSAANFQSGKWGTVTCASGKNVAWLKCATFDTCKIMATGSDAIWVDQSYWGVQGWENSTNTTTSGACFHAGPSGSSSIHHIVFANNVANACMGGGFTAYNKPLSTTASVDYIAYVGNVAYNAAQGTGACYSGLNIYQPIASDTTAGTHMFIAGNFAYNNVDASPCNSGLTTDGEGINLDTFDFSQGGGTAYTQQAAVENNIAVSNGSMGILIENNKTGASQAPVFFKQNTTYGNLKATNLSFCAGHGEITAQAALHVTATGNLTSTNSATGCSGNAIYGFAVADSDNTVSVGGNWLAGTSGNNTFISASGAFAYGSNVLGTSPAFTSTTIPGAPSCGSSANVPACMAALISGFTPTAAGAAAYGYQAPASTPVTDPYFPTWLCNTGLPSGLVSSPCGQVYTGPITLSATTTVKAIATASGLTTSAVGSSLYTLSGGGGPTVTAAPTAAPAAGNYFATQTVALSDSTPGATICFTTDGSTPAGISGTCSAGTTYSSTITVSSSETINAIGTTSGLTNSAVASFAYSISAPTPSQRGTIDYTQIKSLERLGPGNMFQMVNVGTYSAVNAATPCNSTNAGGTAFVTDSTTATYAASISGGGSNKVHALCNGSTWVVD